MDLQRSKELFLETAAATNTVSKYTILVYWRMARVKPLHLKVCVGQVA